MLWRGWRLTLPLGLTVIALGLVLSAQRIASPPLPRPERYLESVAFRLAPGEAVLDLDRVAVPLPFEIRSGQTLGGLLMDLGLEPPEVYSAAAAFGDVVDVRKIRAGEAGVATYDEAGLASVRLDLVGKGRAELARQQNGWTSSWREFEREVEVCRVAGELEDFLEGAIRRSGGPPHLAYAMAEVLQWDLDFNRDLRIGDSFRVLYEEVYLDGYLYDVGEIRALVYENRGRRIEAYRYGDGYYDGEGRPLRKMFLRSPMRFTRVTSKFSLRRFHPVLKVHRPHYGVDYGAPRGTPARVTAGGVVTFVGRNGGAGNMVRVRHPNGYETSYLHLSGYGPGIRRGKRVHQGDTIGFVGSTGLSTAPHLDYRVRKDGRWIDPLTLQEEPAEPIPTDELEAFIAERERLLDKLGVDAASALKVAEGTPSAPRDRTGRPERENRGSA